MLKNPIMVALDMDSADTALDLAEKLSGKVGAFKIGPRLNLRYGQDLVQKIAAQGPVFIDNKFLDIPNTMLAAVRSAFDAGATFCTVHAWSGLEALGRLYDLEEELNKERPFKILVVTILTSFTEEMLPPTMVREPIDVQVRRLTRMAAEAGMSGFVCSPIEVAELRQENKEAFLVTPGIRLPKNRPGDQKRVLGPKEAMDNGASALVIGRPIVEATDPVAAAEEFTALVQ